jgi:flagellar basal-body rod protein FlgC
MYGSLDISTSALVAQRTRLDAIAANIAAADIGGNPNGPVPPPPVREVLFAVGDPANGLEDVGVHVAEIRQVRAYLPREERWNPLADENGMVWYPDINPVEQQTNAMLAVRSYEANIAAIEATKTMTRASLEMLA